MQKRCRRYDDHGSARRSDDFPRELSFLRMTSAPRFVGKPERDGAAERFIRTGKENLLWVRHFESVAERIDALCEFKRRYAEMWLIERHGFRMPNPARGGFAAPKGWDAGPTCRNVG
jgi:hypothetical protein